MAAEFHFMANGPVPEFIQAAISQAIDDMPSTFDKDDLDRAVRKVLDEARAEGVKIPSIACFVRPIHDDEPVVDTFTDLPPDEPVPESKPEDAPWANRMNPPSMN